MKSNSSWICALGVLGVAWAAGLAAAPPAPADQEAVMEKGVKTDAEWRALLTPEQYRMTRQRGTERACSGPFHAHHEPGTCRINSVALRLEPRSPGK